MKVTSICLTEKTVWSFGKPETLSQSELLRGRSRKSCLLVASSLLTTFPKCILSYFCPPPHPPLLLHELKHEWGKHYVGLLSPGERRMVI